MDDLEHLCRGMVIVVTGEMPYSLSRRLAVQIRRRHGGRLRIKIQGPDHPIDREALTLIVPSYNKSINHWLDRHEIFGIVQSNGDANSFKYTDCFTGKQTSLELPAIAENAAGALSDLGFEPEGTKTMAAYSSRSRRPSPAPKSRISPLELPRQQVARTSSCA